MFDDTIVDKQIGEAIRPDGFIGDVRPTKCKWCYSLIYSDYKKNHHKKRGENKPIFCSLDCKEEEKDWRFLCNVRKFKISENKKKRIFKGKDLVKEKNRKKAYYEANKEKIKKQMVAIRLKNKQNKKVEILLDKKK